MSRPITVRPFERRDLKRIAEIEQASFGADAWPAEAFLQYWNVSRDLFLVALYGNRIAGYSIARIAWRGGELDSIAVDPRYRGRGIAKALMNRTIAPLRSKHVPTLRLMVSTTNHAAIRFYQSYGFVRGRRFYGYYAARRDAWRMALAIGITAKSTNKGRGTAKHRPGSANTAPS